MQILNLLLEHRLILKRIALSMENDTEFIINKKYNLNHHDLSFITSMLPKYTG